jgi:hypothetical protein
VIPFKELVRPSFEPALKAEKNLWKFWCTEIVNSYRHVTNHRSTDSRHS